MPRWDGEYEESVRIENVQPIRMPRKLSGQAGYEAATRACEVYAYAIAPIELA